MLEICLYLSNLKTYETVVYLSMKYKDWSTKWDVNIGCKWTNFNKNSIYINYEIKSFSENLKPSLDTRWLLTWAGVPMANQVFGERKLGSYHLWKERTNEISILNIGEEIPIKINWSRCWKCVYISAIVEHMKLKYKDWSTKWDIHVEHRWRNSNKNQLK